MKKITKILSMMMAIVMMYTAFATTAYAAGETLYHKGTSSIGYYTTQSVPQKSDNMLKCTNLWATASGMKAYAVEATSSGYTAVSAGVNIALYAKIYIPDCNYVRDIHLRIQNTGNSEGVSRETEARWQLYATYA